MSKRLADQDAAGGGLVQDLEGDALERAALSEQHEGAGAQSAALSAKLLLGGLTAAALAACGGGGGDAPGVAPPVGGASPTPAPSPGASPTPTPAPTPAPSPTPPPVGTITELAAARFLGHAAFSSPAAEIDKVMRMGYDAWIDEQFAMPAGRTFVASMSPGGPDNDGDDGRFGVERAFWRKLITYPDVLRQRVTFALSEILVISIIPVNISDRGYSCAAFMDILQANAFGNYRDILMQVSTSTAMGSYLSFRGNKKANGLGSEPDENYAREIMQLFSIGAVELELDGTPKRNPDGSLKETYKQADVSGLARVFTGWTWKAGTPVTQPMVQVPADHELGPKTFLGTTIPANTNGQRSLELAIDVLMKHESMAPFIGRQLIQRLVTSNPSPDYVKRVATAFNGNASRPKGDMKATIKAVLTDPEAISPAGLTDSGFGKLREPVMRFVQWARTFNLSSTADTWLIGDLSDPQRELGQSPLRAPSVFNFFRPGYVPPKSSLGTAPEFEIVDETSVAGYLNFMRNVISTGTAGKRADYSALMPLVSNSAALLNELNLRMAAGQISTGTLATLKAALDSIDVSTDAGKNNRIYAAVMLVMAAPEYLVQK
jgi:uncharacterized protein (DUF1800 family)